MTFARMAVLVVDWLFIGCHLGRSVKSCQSTSLTMFVFQAGCVEERDEGVLREVQ